MAIILGNKRLKKRIFISLSVILILIAASFSAFYFLKKKPREIKPIYTQVYRLVPEKISCSAKIPIQLPPRIDKSYAKDHIKFTPEIKGKWLVQRNWFFAKVFAAENSGILYFQPEEKLKLNKYYLVELTTPDGGIMRSDFLAVEDPKIVAVFPRENSEAPENSEITIVFNRPMVPLTTLEYIEEKEVPVEIQPETKGRFKWITTSNLQFIPEERLIRSSKYRVKIKPMVSVDGIETVEKEFEFFTRKLRYLELTSGMIIYNQPISIYFNQPVDLERTKKEMTLIDNATGKEIEFIAEYKKIEEKREGFFGKVEYFLARILPREEELDKSIIQIYKKEDKFGRRKIWDFEQSYTLKIERAYPLEGDIILDERRSTNVQVASPIKNLSAESQRTDFAGLDYFDPQGKLWVDFYEEIDLSKTKIKSEKLKEIGYAKECKDSECNENKKRIYLTFFSERIGLGERIQINFEKIYNVEGLKINEHPILKDIISYPKFEILRTFPENGSKGTELAQLIVCSNSQILTPAKEEFEKYFESNLDFQLNYWGRSWRIEQERYEKCKRGEFQTRIDWGLMPLSDYSFSLKFEDVFGQKIDYSLSFTTGQMPSFHLEFYHLQKSYNVTTPEKTKLTYATQNMEYLNLEICKLNAKDLLKFLEEKIEWDEPTPKFICQKIIDEKIELPKRYWIKNYFKIDLKDYFENPIGHYILTFSNPNYKSSYRDWRQNREIEKQIFERTYLTVTNLAVAEKRILPETETYFERKPLTPSQLKELKNLYFVIDLSNLEAVSGAKVELYRGEGLILADSYFTDSQGIAFTDIFPDLKGAIVSKGLDSTVIPSRESRLSRAEEAFAAEKIYLFTDKPIYRPGQEVFVKGIHRIGYDGSYEIYRDKKINLKVFNSKGNEILSQDLEINDFGTFNTKFILEKNASLGSYRICAQEYSCIFIDVQEYVPAPFEVKLETDKEEYVSKDTVNLKVFAQYYFGVPLEGGEVEYTISSQNYYFDRYKDEYFDFDSEWYYWPPHEFGEKFILRGKASLDNKGRAQITQNLDLEKLFPEKERRKSKIIVFDVTVKNPHGQSVSGQKSFFLHSGEFYLGLKPEKYFLGKNEKFNLRVKSVDIGGKPIEVKDIQFNLYKIDWIYSKRQEAGGGYSYSWEKKRELIESFRFNTDSQGNFQKELQISKEGEYELEVEAKDKRGNFVFATHYLYVYGEGAVRIRPTTDTQLEIETEKIDLNVGDTARVIIKSPYDMAKALITLERGKIYEYQIKEIKGNLYPFSFGVKEEYLPNVYLSVLLISKKPEIKFGNVEFQINRELKEIEVEVKSNKKFYLPGEEVILDIFTKDFRGNPAPAEVSIAVVDLSVLALKGNPKKNPLIFFYAGFPLTVSTASNIKDILIPVEIPTKGGAGMAPEALAIKKRGIFRETAFWQAIVQTDENGKAQVKFTLPDNLTTWQTETVGVTRDTELGVGYLEFITKKELMVVPLKPRFVIPGDIFFIGAQIFNQSKDAQRVKVKFESQSLILKDGAEREIRILPGETETVYFKVQAPPQIKSGKHIFLISAKSQTLEDTVEMGIKITPNNTYEVTASSNYTNLPIFKEYVFLPENVERDRGELTIKSSATLAVFLSDALNYLLQFPYGCSEQIASKLDAIAIVKRGLNLPNIGEKFKLEKIEYRGKEYTIEELVEIGLAELYNNQQYDGGFSFWRGGNSDFYLTLHVVETFSNLSLAGFSVNQNSLDRALNFIQNKITTEPNLYRDKDTIILAAYTLFKFPKFEKSDFLRDKIIEIVKDDLFLKEKINNISLSKLAILLNWGFDKKLREKVYEILDNRIEIDGRGAFLEAKENFIWRYYETPIKNTALYLKAKVAAKSEDPILEKVLRWLLNSRKKDGAWGSTQNTVSVVDALTDFLEWKRETQSNFILELFLNGKSEGSFEFNPETILDQFKKEIPIQALKFNQNNEILFKKENLNQLPNAYYYDLSLKYYLPADRIPSRDEGFAIIRNFYRLEDQKNENPVFKAKVGEVLRGNIQIVVPESSNFLIIEDFIPAGMEIVNLDLATEQKSLRLQERELKGREFHPDFKEIHDDRVFLYKENLAPGVYEFDYYVRALIKGEFVHLPAQVSEMYFPEIFGRTEGRYFEIE